MLWCMRSHICTNRITRRPSGCAWNAPYPTTRSAKSGWPSTESMSKGSENKGRLFHLRPLRAAEPLEETGPREQSILRVEEGPILDHPGLGQHQTIARRWHRPVSCHRLCHEKFVLG